MEPSRTDRAAPVPADALDLAEDFDTPAEVDALFRTQRRIAVGYFAVFLVVTIGVPALTLVVDWWSEGRLIGGMSPAFVMAAVGLYAFFGFLAVAVGALANAVEDRMLGDPTGFHDDAFDGDAPFDAGVPRDGRGTG